MKRCDPRKEKTIGIGDFRDWTDEITGKRRRQNSPDGGKRSGMMATISFKF